MQEELIVTINTVELLKLKLKRLGRRYYNRFCNFMEEQGREGELSMFDLVHGTHLLEEYRAMKRAERINRKRKQYDLRAGVHACIARRST